MKICLDSLWGRVRYLDGLLRGGQGPDPVRRRDVLEYLHERNHDQLPDRHRHAGVDLHHHPPQLFHALHLPQRTPC